MKPCIMIASYGSIARTVRIMTIYDYETLSNLENLKGGFWANSFLTPGVHFRLVQLSEFNSTLATLQVGVTG